MDSEKSSRSSSGIMRFCAVCWYRYCWDLFRPSRFCSCSSCWLSMNSYSKYSRSSRRVYTPRQFFWMRTICSVYRS